MSGLIGDWQLDDGSEQTAADSSGNSYDATLGSTGSLDANDPVWATCSVGGSALEFDGVDDYVEDPDGELYINGLTAFTASAWIKSDVIGTDRGFLHTVVPDGSDSFLGIRYDAAGSQSGFTNVIKVGLSVDGVNQLLESSANIQTTSWQHVALTWSSGNQFALYLAGSLDTPGYNEPGRVGSVSNATTLFIGKGGKDDVNGGWDGLVDQVRLYDRVLTAGEISALAATAPSGRVTPAAAVSGTITGSVTEEEIVAGGETLAITLTNDTWVAAGGTFDAERQNIIDGLDSAQAEGTGWDAVVKAGLKRHRRHPHEQHRGDGDPPCLCHLRHHRDRDDHGHGARYGGGGSQPDRGRTDLRRRPGSGRPGSPADPLPLAERRRGRDRRGVRCGADDVCNRNLSGSIRGSDRL